MKHSKRTFLITIAVFALGSLLAACTSTGRSSKQQPDELVQEGIEAWNSQGPLAAQEPWNRIADEGLRNTWLSNIGRIEKMEKDLLSIKTLSREAQKLVAFKQALAAGEELGKGLSVPDSLKDEGRALAEDRIAALLLQDSFAEARSIAARSEKLFGSSRMARSLLEEISVIERARTDAKEAQGIAEQAGELSNFDERIARYNEAIKAVTEAENTLTASSRELLGGAAAKGEAKNLKRQRQDLEIQRDTEIRQKVYAFKDRIGEAFAEAPKNNKGGILGLEELLAHQKQIKENINAVYDEMTVFAGQYPESIDQGILEEVDLQKRDLELKIIQVNNELKTAKEIASRGKVVMPVMIGLFNPEPGRDGESKKSRPARFSAKKVKRDEYWWGMISIPPGVMNDLVVTVKDNRTVRVFGENTYSGKLIKKNQVSDLVNRAYKIGNSWPVLNAGSQLPTNKYFFEVQEGKTPEYEGEVVVYSSFVVRMR